MASLTKPFASLSLRASSSRLTLPYITRTRIQFRASSNTPPYIPDTSAGSSGGAQKGGDSLRDEAASASGSGSESSAGGSSVVAGEAVATSEGTGPISSSSVPSTSESSSASTTATTTEPSTSTSAPSSSPSVPSTSSTAAIPLHPEPKPNSTSSFLASLSPSTFIPHKPIPRSPSFPTTFLNAPLHKHINFPQPLFTPPAPSDIPPRIGLKAEQRREEVSAAVTGLERGEVRDLRRYTVVMKRVVKMTKKGKMPSWMSMIIVGSPERGLVGIGRGRGITVPQAMDAGFHKAVQSMDYVNKYENRTLWSAGQDMKFKWGSTTIILRARPAGFGLMVPPVIHRVLTCAGIKDCSATIEGSRNPMQVLKATVQLLHPGANPPGFGSGVGTKGRREDKGLGMRSKDEIEIERGRYGVDVGRRV